MDTLEYVKTLNAVRFVPAHAPVTEEIGSLAELNLQAIRKVRERILALCSEPIAFEELLQKIFAAYGMEMNLQQYALIGSTLRSYLTGLYEEGLVSFFFDEGRMLWKA